MYTHLTIVAVINSDGRAGIVERDVRTLGSVTIPPSLFVVWVFIVNHAPTERLHGLSVYWYSNYSRATGC